MPIGPQLPPHLAHLSARALPPKSTTPSPPSSPGPTPGPGPAPRSASNSSDSTNYGPALPPHLAAARKAKAASASAQPAPAPAPAGPVAGPSRPRIHSRSPSPPRIAGRAPAPARPPVPVDDDSDDDIGPSLSMIHAAPTKSAAEEFKEREARMAESKAISEGRAAESGEVKRQEWMLVPPEAGVLSNVDPLKKRPSTFSRNAAAPAGADSSWTETPAERRQRAADELAGIKPKAKHGAGAVGPKQKAPGGDEYGTKRRRDEDVRAEVERYTKATRGPSLLDKHQSKPKAGDEDDAPPAIWDHARDMGITGRLMTDQERQTKIRDAKNLNDRFGHSSRGAYQM